MRAELSLLALSAFGCAVNLDPDPPRPRVSSNIAQLPGCQPLADRVDSVEGRLDLIQLSDGRPLALAAQARFDGQVRSAAFTFRDGPAFETCLSSGEPLPARPLIDTSELPGRVSASPLASVTTDQTYLYFAASDQTSFAAAGFGVARWDPAAERFVAVGFLWTADRPPYGSSAIVEGDYVYVFGGLAARFLAADAYVARAPLASLTEPSAYEYWTGGGDWSQNADAALPLVEAGTAPSVSWDAAHSRWLMAYTTPLASEVTVRSGLGVTGPWSAPVTLGRCDLPSDDTGAFCGDVVLVPALTSEGGIVATQATGTFGRVEGADYGTRLIGAAWPGELP